MNTELTNDQAEELAGMAWKLVPIEPTDAMTYIGQTLRYDSANSIGDIYRKMLSAAPTPPSAPVQQSVREAFESHQLGRYQYADITRHTDGRYLNAFMESEWETWQAALSASPAGDKVEGEPVAWAVFADNGNIRLWSANKSTVERFADENEKPAAPLYTHPQPPRPDSNELGGGEK
jgi:hypothetical protein